MADTAVAITAGTGTNIDTRTEGTNGNHRQVIVIGDPATNAGVAPVDATNGLAVYNVQALTVASHAVTNAGTFAVQDSRFATEDAAASSDPVGPVLMAVRRDTLSTSEVSADGDNIALKATNKGKLHVAAEMRFGDTVADLGSGTGGSATQRVIMDSSQLAALATSQQAFSAGAQGVYLPSDHPTLPVTPAGNVAHDAADSGNPVKQGFKATTALSGLTLVSSGDRTDGFAGVDGVQIVRPHCNLEGIVTGNATNTDGTSTECIAAQAAGIKVYLTSIILANTSATAITVDIKDGTTVKISLPLPAGSGCVFNPPVPIPGTAATAWNFDGSAAATTVTCSMIGFKSKV